MRLPNNFGNVSKLPGKRRNPWRARKLLRYEIDADGHLRNIWCNVGYYPTRTEAIAALVEYNKNSEGVEPDIADLTLEQVYSRWAERKYPSASPSLLRLYQCAWNITPDSLARTPITKIKLVHLQDAADRSNKSSAMLERWKMLLGQVYDYAVMYDIIPPDRDKTKYIDISRARDPAVRPHKRLSPGDVDRVWSHPDCLIRDVTLLLIYSGCRPSELLRLTAEDVNLKDRYFDIRQSKTAAGVRLVPIAEKVVHIWERYLTCSGQLFSLTVQNISAAFPVPGYTSYDCRHTCISMLAEAGVDERVIQQIVGHKGQNVTRQVYTHLTMKPLLEAINRI